MGKQAFKLVLRPLSALSLVVPMFGVLGAALAAKAALARGESWRTVAKRWSVDSSAQIGGAFAVVEGEQSPVLERAVFTAKRGQIVGPVKTPPEAGAPLANYYLFEVTGAHPGSQRSLAEVTAQIKLTLTQQLQQQAWAAFSSAYERRWRVRTLCAPGYVVAECRNSAASTRGRAP
jgi:foldase protein PrsA